MDSNISDTSAATATRATDIKGHWDLGPRGIFFFYFGKYSPLRTAPSCIITTSWSNKVHTSPNDSVGQGTPCNLQLTLCIPQLTLSLTKLASILEACLNAIDDDFPYS